MNLIELWATLDEHIQRFGALEERQVKHFLRKNSPSTLRAIEKTEAGGASSDEISTASRFFRYYMDHRRYEQIIQKYDQSLDFCQLDHEATKEFMGRGAGGSSFASYRVARHGNYGDRVFEKVYYLDSTGFRRTQYFYRHIINQIDLDFGIPPLVETRRGKRLAIVYFGYRSDLESFLEASSKEKGISLMTQRYALLQEYLSKIEDPRKRGKKNHSSFHAGALRIYSRGRASASAFLTKIGKSPAELDHIESLLIKQPMRKRVFAHGDLSTENFFVNSIIDFDNSGWYPPGYDLAFMLSLAQTFEYIDDILQWTSDQNLLALNKRYVKLSFLYFCFIFYSRRVRGIVASDKWLQSVWEKVCQLSA